MKLYGISTCDSVRKARRILDQRGAHYQYIDLRQNPPDDALLRDWFARFGSALVNKRSTTYREHKAKAGIYGYSAGAGWEHQLDENWTTGASVGVTRLTGKAGDSPIVKKKTAATGMATVRYNF